MAIITTGQTFTATDTVTNTKLQDIADAATFNDPVDETTLELIIGGSNAGKLGIKDAGVTKAKIENVANLRVLGNTSGSVVAPQEVEILDDDTMATATATKLATSESIKAYVDNLALGIKSVSSTTVSTVTATLPLDSTTPLVTEGTEILSTVFTATDSSNKLLIKFNGLLAGQTQGIGQVMALFRGNSCVGAKWWAQPADGTNLTQCEFLIDALNTSSNTYSIRYGPGAAGQTSYVNTQGNVPGGASLGGFQNIAMTIQEVNSI